LGDQERILRQVPDTRTRTGAAWTILRADSTTSVTRSGIADFEALTKVPGVPVAELERRRDAIVF
jgi:hypothetical protein